MPKLGMNNDESELAEDLRRKYGGMLKVSDVCTELGYKQRRMAVVWLSDVPCYIVNNVAKYRVSDIARKLYACKV